MQARGKENFFSVLGTRPGGARAGGAPHKEGGGLGKRAARGLGGPVGWCPEDVGGVLCSVAWWLKRAWCESRVMWGGAQRGPTAACFPYYYLRLSYKMCTAGWRAELSRSGKEAADAKSRIPRPRPHPQEGKRAFRATLRPPWGLKWPAGKPGGRRRSWDQQGATGRPRPFGRPSDHRARHQSAAPLRPQGLLL